MKNYKNRFLKQYQYLIILLVVIVTAIINSCSQEVSVSPPDEPPPHGFVLIDSKPQGAHIYLDGKNRRRITPDSLTWLETNTYTVTLKKDLYRDTSITISAVDGEKKNYFIDYTLNPAMRGKINCTAKPDGSDIYLDGVQTGLTTPAVLTGILPGYYSVRFSAPNFRDDSLQVTVSSSNISVAKTTLVDTTKWTDYTTQRSQIPTNKLTGITIDKNDVLWIGTEENGLLSFDGTIWNTYQQSNSLINDQKVNALIYHNDGTLWAATKNGLFLKKGSVEEVYNSFAFGQPLPENFMVALGESNEQSVFIAGKTNIIISGIDGVTGQRNWLIKNRSSFGIQDEFTAVGVSISGTLFAGTTKSGLIVAQSLYSTANSGILGNSISALQPDPSGGMWIGFKTGVATGAGVSLYKDNAFQNFFVLPSGGNVNSIYVDDLGNKWVGTTAGLTRFTNSSDVQRIDSESTGLNITDVRGVVKDSKGRIWIATFGGGLILKKK